MGKSKNELNQYIYYVMGNVSLGQNAGPPGRAGSVWTGSPRQKDKCITP